MWGLEAYSVLRRDGGGKYQRLTATYRKVLQAVEAARAVVEVAVASTVFAIVGFLLYTLVYPSGVVLFEALVWSIEAMAFTGVWLALRVAASRTAFYKARYEILRAEALAVIILSLIGLAATAAIVYKTFSGSHEPTPVWLASYPLASAAASYVLEHMLEARMGSLGFRLVSVRAVSSKLRYDVIVEVAGGLAIIASNLLHSSLAEQALIGAVAVYVAYGLLGLLYEHLLYLIGPGPRERRLQIRRLIEREAARLGFHVARMRIEVYGTFAEAEVWVEMHPYMRLHSANRRSQELARHLVRVIPDLLRVVVIPVPARRRVTLREAGQARYRRISGGEASSPEGSGGREGHSR